MKSCHDFDSVVSLESLGTIRKRYSILNEYVLHAPRPEQCPYHPYLGGFGISIDALEAGLRFSLHSIIGECLRSWPISASFAEIVSMSLMRGPSRDRLPPTMSLTPAQPTEARSTSMSKRFPPRGQQGGPRRKSVGRLRKPMTSARQKPPQGGGGGGGGFGGRKKRKVLGCKSHHDGEKSKAQSSKGKEPIVMVKEAATPRSRPKSIKDIYSVRLRKDVCDYHTIWVGN
ncbi:hypothetical protein GW17_00023957 [Ensete ventricosum]|nr:hypothetical protein GW17_00023957 [Ensete ventricosum]